MENLPRRGLSGIAPASPTAPARTGSTKATAREQVGLAILAVERAGRGALARMRRSRLLRWRYRSPSADELLLAPPDLRVPDPTLADELAAGSFGLAGVAAELDGHSPFTVRPPSLGWARELHGFGWLRHLDQAQSDEARTLARDLLGEWMRRSRRRAGPCWEPQVVARRVISWLSHASLLLEGAHHRRYGAFMTSLADQITFLSASWRNVPDGYPRLLALIGLVSADLCICDHDRQLEQSQKLLGAEMERQVLAGGGHASRNPSVLIELLLDLLPLRQCFAARGKTPEPRLLAAITRMTGMLRHLRLGDGRLARFNGMGATERDVLATVLTYDDDGRSETAIRDGYARLARGSLVVIVDAGAAPPLELAGTTCAGCLSFELSTGRELLLVNAGAPGAPGAAHRAVARATASHNTLCLGEQSSARLMRDTRLERAIGNPPLAHPDHVTCELREKDGGSIEVEASHDGYVERFGLVHARNLEIDAAGTRITGRDRLSAAKGVVRFAWDIPLAIHFHLHPEAQARVGPSPEAAELVLGSGEQWRLTATGAAVTIEESAHFAEAAAAQPCVQVVLRAQCCGATEVSWVLERIKVGSGDPSKRRKDRVAKRLAERLAETVAGFEPPRR